MDTEAATELIEFLSSRGGSLVRAAAYHDEDDHELLYIRDDIADQYTEADIERIAEQMRTQIRRSRAERVFKMGEFRCSLLGFEDGIVLHFPQGGERGTVVTLEADAARQFNEFVEECAKRIYGQ